MTIRTIVIYPDQRLFKSAAMVDVSADKLQDVRVVAQDLFDTMRNASGVGITAPHIGLFKRIVVLSLPDSDGAPNPIRGAGGADTGAGADVSTGGGNNDDTDDGIRAAAEDGVEHNVDAAVASDYQVYINPEIIAASPDTVQFEEGSISMPGVIEKIVRSARVTIRYVDLNGDTRIEEAEGFRAVCHQHEIDQLNGVFWTEKLSRLKRERVVTRFVKLRRGA